MGDTAKKVKESMYGSIDSRHAQTRGGMIALAEGVDVLNDLIKNSHNIQMVSRKADDLSEKKTKALMIVIDKIYTKYINRERKQFYDNDIPKLFEKAKAISRAENETEFQSAIVDL